MICLVPAHCTICIGGQTVLGAGCSAGKSLGLFVALCLVLPVAVVLLLVVQPQSGCGVAAGCAASGCGVAAGCAASGSDASACFSG